MPVSLQDLTCCVHLGRRGQVVQHPRGCGATTALRAGSVGSIQLCQLRRSLVIGTGQTPLRQPHGAGAVLHSVREDGVVMELPPRVVPGRRIPVKGSTCHTGMPSAGAVVETLRCLNCRVVREEGSQGLVQVMAFLISHWHPKKQLDVLSLCFSLECFSIPPSSMFFWSLTPEERISAQVLHLVPQQQ